MENFSIGHLVRETGTKVQTIRYYEQIGIMPKAMRTAGNQRIYSQKDLQRLGFIRHARQLGFSLKAVRSLLALGDDPGAPCLRADNIAREHLAEVESRITRLEALRRELQRMTNCCDGASVTDCRILETLADHDLCIHDEH